MATPFTFQSLNFDNIPSREIEARRRQTGALEGLFKGLGESADNVATAYTAEEERKKREAEDKKKWDNMIAQQEYQKEQNRINREYQASRDAITDARYNNEWNEKQKKLQLEENKYYRDRNALENLKAEIRQAYTPEALQKYGPSAQARLAAILNSNDLATAHQQVGELSRDMYLQDMMDFQREQNAANEKRTFAEDRPNKITRSTLSHLTDKRIDISSGYLPTSRKEAQRWLAEVNDALMAQNSITQDGVSEHSDFSSKVTSSLNSLQRKLQEFLGQTPNGY